MNILQKGTVLFSKVSFQKIRFAFVIYLNIKVVGQLLESRFFSKISKFKN
jgi:hypothetical protein